MLLKPVVKTKQLIVFRDEEGVVLSIGRRFAHVRCRARDLCERALYLHLSLFP